MFYGVSIMILRKDMEVKMGLGGGKRFFKGGWIAGGSAIYIEFSMVVALLIPDINVGSIMLGKND